MVCHIWDAPHIRQPHECAKIIKFLLLTLMRKRPTTLKGYTLTHAHTATSAPPHNPPHARTMCAEIHSLSQLAPINKAVLAYDDDNHILTHIKRTDNWPNPLYFASRPQVLFIYVLPIITYASMRLAQRRSNNLAKHANYKRTAKGVFCWMPRRMRIKSISASNNMASRAPGLSVQLGQLCFAYLVLI